MFCTLLLPFFSSSYYFKRLNSSKSLKHCDTYLYSIFTFGSSLIFLLYGIDRTFFFNKIFWRRWDSNIMILHFDWRMWPKEKIMFIIHIYNKIKNVFMNIEKLKLKWLFFFVIFFLFRLHLDFMCFKNSIIIEIWGWGCDVHWSIVKFLKEC